MSFRFLNRKHKVDLNRNRNFVAQLRPIFLSRKVLQDFYNLEQVIRSNFYFRHNIVSKFFPAALKWL